MDHRYYILLLLFYQYKKRIVDKEIVYIWRVQNNLSVLELNALFYGMMHCMV